MVFTNQNTINLTTLTKFSILTHSQRNREKKMQKRVNYGYDAEWGSDILFLATLIGCSQKRRRITKDIGRKQN